MKNHIVFFIIIFCSDLSAQTARNTQTGLFARVESYSTQADASSFRGNQASLSGLRQFSSSIGTERKFLLNEISQSRLAVAVPTSGGNFALCVNYLGGNIYSEVFSSLSYARRMGKIDIGIQFNHFLAKNGFYGNASAVNFDLGFIMHLTDQIHAGAHIYNPLAIINTGSKSLQLPCVYSAGFGYEASENFFAGCIIEKEISQPLSIDVAVKYVFAKSLFARLGLRTGTTAFSFGTGIIFNSFRLELLTTMHPQLGLSPAFMIIYHPITKK